MHGTGNDFIVLNALNGRVDSVDEGSWPQLAVAMNDRHFGIGGDGIIVAPPSERAALRMRMFNPDGSEAELCGNGLRCLAKYAVEHELARPRDGAITVETLAGVLRCQLLEENGTVALVRVSMGRP